jgi:hypothetical protein
MAGLLDFFGNGWDDPKSNAVMALAGGLLDGDFAGGMKGYAGVMAGAKDAQLKRAMQQAQIDKYGADTEIDKQKLSLSQGKEKRDNDFESMMMDSIKKRLGGGVAMPNMPVTGSGGNQGGQGTPNSGQSFEDPFAGVNPMAMMLDMRNNSGKKIGDWVNDRTAPKWENINGNMVNTNAPNFTGGFQSGFKAADNGQVTMFHPDGQGGLVVGAPKGALDTYSAFRNADEAAKSRTSLTTITRPDGTTSLMPNDLVLREARGQSQQPMQQAPMQSRPAAAGSEAQIIANGMGGLNGLPTVARGGNVSFKSTPQEMDKPRILQDAFADASARFEAAQKVGDTASMRRAQSDVESIRSEFSKIGRPQSLAPNQAPNTAPQSAPSFGLELQSQAGKDQQKLISENAGKVNDVWLKSSYTPIVESKGATTATLDSINQSRAAMTAMGGTGWGTETKATAANVLAGLGIGGKNAEMYATNAQTFQQAAMTRLQSELALQKGPQTEGDAERQSATYAALKNTPQANTYILDSAQAKAERDLMKARFYESALPIASKKGDLQEIDREWNKRAPSLFSMPSMQKWAKK